MLNHMSDYSVECFTPNYPEFCVLRRFFSAKWRSDLGCNYLKTAVLMCTKIRIGPSSDINDQLQSVNHNDAINVAT